MFTSQFVTFFVKQLFCYRQFWKIPPGCAVWFWAFLAKIGQIEIGQKLGKIFASVGNVHFSICNIFGKQLFCYHQFWKIPPGDAVWFGQLWPKVAKCIMDNVQFATLFIKFFWSIWKKRHTTKWRCIVWAHLAQIGQIMSGQKVGKCDKYSLLTQLFGTLYVKQLFCYRQF